MTNHMTARPMQSPLLTQWGYEMFLLACCFSGCCVEIFSYLDTCLCKALWEFVSELKVLDVCIYEALMNQNWPQPGWSKHLFFVWHLHRWPVWAHSLKWRCHRPLFKQKNVSFGHFASSLMITGLLWQSKPFDSLCWRSLKSVQWWVGEKWKCALYL